MKKILFVCMGNICRSPVAEGIFKKIVLSAGLEKDFFIDSAGTIAYHSGERADVRMRKHAAKRGYMLDSISRQLQKKDLAEFDYIVAMDGQNYRDILLMDREAQLKGRLVMMTEFSEQYAGKDVPDPYYGGSSGFELVLDMVEESAKGLLRKIQDNGF